MRRLAACAIALALAGACDGDDPPRLEAIDPPPAEDREPPTAEATAEAPTPDEPSPDQPSRPAQPPAPEDPTPQPPLPLAEEGRAHVFVVPEGAELSVSVDTRVLYGGGEFDVEGDPRLERILDDRLGALARAAIADAEIGGGEEVATDCDVPLTSDHLVSVVCSVTDYGERGETEHASVVYHLAIEDGAVRDMQLAEVFVPGTDLDPLLDAGCARARAEDSELPACDSREHTRLPYLDIDGLTVALFNPYDPFDEQPSFLIPYAELASRLVAAGPLARALDRAAVQTRPIEVSGEVPTAGRPRWVAGAMAPVGEAATAWSTLAPELRARTRVEGGYLVGADEAAARAAATALGVTARRTEVHPGSGGAEVTLTLAATRREVELLAAPYDDAEVTEALPRGAVVVATRPLGSPDAFVYVYAHAELGGYVQARRLEVEDACAPDLGPFLATLPEPARAAARLRTRRDVRASGSWGRATFVTEHDGSTHVGMHRVAGGCATDRALARFTLPGPLESLTVTRTARRGGESVIVAVHGGATRAVRAHVFGDPEPVWSRPLGARDRVETSVREDAAWLPIVVRPASGSPVRVTWGEGGPEVSAAP